ncbi:hypothetical protein K502DRAFT_286721 [Neoconidiobolus thromboides FSU 785]|nr:hypothetical protein K502DRAFT_286721 [Neoconidiobolus thromboides FSU 785]
MSCLETSLIIKGNYSPIERIALTANGNLQRILSAFYNSKIKVEIVKNVQRDLEQGSESIIFDREVDLVCNDKILCSAKSVITVEKEEYKSMIKSQQVGVGQLFRVLSILPKFRLIEVGRLDSDNRLYRTYSLSAEGVDCLITETFAKDIFQFSD